MIGDPITERRIVEDTMAQAGLAQCLDGSCIDNLYKNGLEWFKNTSEGGEIKIGVALTKSQVAALTHDIIIPVEQEINGKIVMVPQVYFSAETLAKAKEIDKSGGQIFARGNLSFTATGNIVNKGFIGSGNKMTITADGDIINTGGELTSGQSMILSGKNVLFDVLTADDGKYEKQRYIRHPRTSQRKGRIGISIIISNSKCFQIEIWRKHFN